jgi:ABC-type oligopeptide transport system substrate-binding subunit
LGTEGQARLLQEAQAVARLNQPNIVAVHDAGETALPGLNGPAAFVVMELVEGQTLRHYRPADLADSRAILEQICDALAAAHEHGIIHRDLKPENVIRTATGQIKLMDFGLARIGDRPRLTQEGTLMGTLDYLAPEIIQGRPASVKSDLYALGVMAYELLTGRPPFQGETPAAVLAQHLHAPATPPSAHNETVPPGLDHLVLLLLNKEPENRPKSATAVGQVLVDITYELADPRSLAGQAGIPAPRLDFLSRGRLVGREREVAEGMALWRRAAAGQLQVLLVSGEPGIGKTRLAAEITALAQFEGARLLEGKCFATGGLPYMPVSQMIRAAFASLDPPTPPTAVLDDILRLAPDIVAEAPAAIPAGAVDEEGQLYESVVLLCQLMARDRPLLLYFDDLQWADSSTMGVIRHLVRRLPDTPLMIVATYREIELGGRRPVRELLDDLRREAGAVRLKLGRLDRMQTEALLSTLLDEVITPEFLDAIYRETEGNPFFVEELCKALVESGELAFQAGQWQQSPREQLRLPESIQLTIEARLEQLDRPSLEILQAAAMLGREFGYDLLRAATASEEPVLIDALDKATQAQLIEELPSVTPLRTGGPLFSFTHTLIQATLLDGLGSLRRRMLAGQVAAALEEGFAGEPAAISLLLGHLYSEAGDGQRAVPYLLRTADDAGRLFAYDEAIESYELALLFLRDIGDPDATARALMTLGATYLKASHFERSRRAYEEAFVLWRRDTEPGERPPPARRPFRSHTAEPLTLDPTQITETASSYIARQLFEGLVDLGPADEVLPAGAASWEILDGGRRYIFRLREDATWSDGHPVTAGDYEYAWKRVLDPAAANSQASSFFDIRGAQAYHEEAARDSSEVGITAVNRHSLRIDLREPVAYFLHLVASGMTFPVPRHIVERYGDRWTELTTIVTNGPFVPELWQPGQKLVLARNQAYSGRFGGNLAHVELDLVNDPALLETYEAGDLDCLYLPLIGSGAQRAWRDFGSEVVSPPLPITTYLAFNNQRDPLDDLRVRQAINLAIDRRRLARQIIAARHEPATSGLIPPGMAGHGLGPRPVHDPDAARRLLADAGYPDGKGLRPLTFLEIASPGDDNSPGAWIRDRLQEALGLETELRQLTLSQMLTEIRPNPPDMWYLAWSADYTDPDSFMRAGDWPATCNWPNETFSRLVDDARLESNLSRRLELYRQAEAMLAEEAPFLPLLYARLHILVKPWVRRFATSAVVWTIFKDVVLDD